MDKQFLHRWGPEQCANRRHSIRFYGNCGKRLRQIGGDYVVIGVRVVQWLGHIYRVSDPGLNRRRMATILIGDACGSPVLLGLRPGEQPVSQSMDSARVQ